MNAALRDAWRQELDGGGCCTPAMQANLDALTDAATRVVVAGQQPGLFLGPLYTLYKALTAVALADRWTRERGARHVPVFWIASEDHDWAESTSLRFPPRGSELGRELRVAGDGGGRALESIAVDPAEVDRLRTACGALAGTGPGADRVAELLERCAPTDWLCERFLGRQCAVVLSGLLGDTGLLPLEARLARPHAGAILERERDDPAGGAAALQALDGPLAADGPLVFAIGPDGVRRRWADGVVGELSPNVALRPVVQDAVLPVAAQVVGPGEAAYLRQLDALYARHDVAVPERVARLSAVLVTPKARAAAERVAGGLDRVLDPTAEEPAPEPLAPDAAAALDALGTGLKRDTAALRDAVTAAAGADASGVERFERTVADALGKLRGRLERDADRRAETGRAQWERLRAELCPGGVPQERVLGCWSYLANHGGDWIAGLLARAAEAAAAPVIWSL